MDEQVHTGSGPGAAGENRANICKFNAGACWDIREIQGAPVAQLARGGQRQVSAKSTKPTAWVGGLRVSVIVTERYFRMG
jgi:hypothetical protein